MTPTANSSPKVNLSGRTGREKRPRGVAHQRRGVRFGTSQPRGGVIGDVDAHIAELLAGFAGVRRCTRRPVSRPTPHPGRFTWSMPSPRIRAARSSGSSCTSSAARNSSQLACRPISGRGQRRSGVNRRAEPLGHEADGPIVVDVQRAAEPQPLVGHVEQTVVSGYPSRRCPSITATAPPSRAGRWWCSSGGRRGVRTQT